MDQGEIWKLWGPLLVITVIFAVRLRGAGKERALRLGTFWIAPLLIVGLVGFMFVSLPPPLAGWLALGVGVAIGAALGWRRGKLIHLWRREDGQLMQQVSPLAILILIGLFGIRFAIMHLAGGDPTAPHPDGWAITLTDFLLGLAVGILVFTRVEIYVRARALCGAGEGKR